MGGKKPIHNFIELLLDYLPAQMHLVIVTRIDPPLPPARLRARNQMIELRVTDLSFSHDETVVFFNKMMKLGLKEQEIAILESRTEGWIAGLQLYNWRHYSQLFIRTTLRFSYRSKRQPENIGLLGKSGSGSNPLIK